MTDRLTEELDLIALRAHRKHRTKKALEGAVGTLVLLASWFFGVALLALIAGLTWNLVVWVWDFAYFMDSIR